MICDAAEGLGSGTPAARSASFGLASCFSFSANKTITAGQGGIVTTDSDALHDRLRELKDQGRRHGGTGGDDLHPVMGYNFKFTDLQAAVALPQLDEIEKRLDAARRRDKFYAERLANQPGLTLPPFDEPGEVRQWTDVLIDNRAAVSKALDDAKIGNRAFWFPLHRQAPYAADAGASQQHRRLAPRPLAGLAVRPREPDFDRICST